MSVGLLVDTVFVAVYVPLLWQAWQWLRVKEAAGAPSPLRSLTLSDNPYPRAAPIAVLAAAHLAGSALALVPLAFLGLVATDSAWRNRDRWVRAHLWALGRLTVPATAVGSVAVMLLFGNTSSLSVWFVTRRLVLTSWPQKKWRSARPEQGR